MPPVNPVEARVRAHAETLLRQHGLTGWTVTFDSAKRRGGQCVHSTRTISLSRPMIKVRPIEESLNTAKHEVAHAIAGPGHNHDHVWRRIFIGLGGNGAKHVDSTKVDYERLAKYVATCPAGHKYYKHRATDDRTRCCSVCPSNPALNYIETATGKPMVCTPYVRRPRKPRQRTVSIRLADGRVVKVPSRF